MNDAKMSAAPIRLYMHVPYWSCDRYIFKRFASKRSFTVTITVNVPMYYNVSDQQGMVVLSVLFTCVCVWTSHITVWQKVSIFIATEPTGSKRRLNRPFLDNPWSCLPQIHVPATQPPHTICNVQMQTQLTVLTRHSSPPPQMSGLWELYIKK